MYVWRAVHVIILLLLQQPYYNKITAASVASKETRTFVPRRYGRDSRRRNKREKNSPPCYTRGTEFFDGQRPFQRFSCAPQTELFYSLRHSHVNSGPSVVPFRAASI